MKIAGIPAIVTGAVYGLGAATARRLAADGAIVAMLDLDGDAAEATAKDIGCIGFVCNVGSADSAEAAIAAARKRHGPAGIVINCAGIGCGSAVGGRDGRPADLAWFERVVRVNLTGTFNVICLAAANMMARAPNEDGERGVIVNTGSTSGYEGQIGQAAYAASKGGVIAMGIALVREFARSGIRVMTISPGPLDTRMFNGMFEGADNRLLDAAHFPRRAGKPEEYAKIVADIVGNPMLNGESIRRDGALRMGRVDQTGFWPVTKRSMKCALRSITSASATLRNAA
ncbi:MAG: SDR family NAD(P)-dependent oxidoreductase [Alphaproteobacteria bacterium]|nr:SDR family NAD(P)-dependent oxidoreductase [Alphaproteobacteria bacterium]